MPHMNGAAKDTGPWFKEPWPWILISLPATAIVAGVITLVLAIRSNDGLVAADYYKQGLTINRTLAKEQFASSMGLVGEARFANGQASISLQAKAGVTLPSRIVLNLVSPANEKADQRLVLDGQSGEFLAALPSLQAGRWNMMIEDTENTWRLRAQAILPSVQAVVFGGQVSAQP